MFRSTAPATLLLLCLLAGCGEPPSDRQPSSNTRNEAATNAASPIKIRNEYQDKLLKLSELDRDLTLRRAVRDDGGACSRIRGSKFQEEVKGSAMWIAHCAGQDWAVFVSPSGSVQARPCNQIAKLNAMDRTLNLPACHAWPADPAEAVAKPSWPEPAPAPRPLNDL